MDTKEKILEIAKNLFLKNGYNKTTFREIALKSGINLALLNYHFRNKDTLFSIAIESILIKLTPPLHKILNSDLNLENKIKIYIYAYIDLLAENPSLIMFVLNVLTHCPEKLVHFKAVNNLYTSEIFEKQLITEAKEKKIKNINPEHLFINILSMIAFPFALKPFIVYKNNFSENELNEFLLERKQIIFETIINAIKT